METSNQYSELSVHCGSNTDSMEKLVDICKEEADKLAETLSLIEGEEVSVPFWTSGPGFPELICTGVFKRNDSGKICYDLDFSESVCSPSPYPVFARWKVGVFLFLKS